MTSIQTVFDFQAIFRRFLYGELFCLYKYFGMNLKSFDLGLNMSQKSSAQPSVACTAFLVCFMFRDSLGSIIFYGKRLVNRPALAEQRWWVMQHRWKIAAKTFFFGKFVGKGRFSLPFLYVAPRLTVDHAY